jgi:hypothetical protein
LTVDHYRRFLGRAVKVVLHTPVQQRRQWQGIIKAVKELRRLLVEQEDSMHWPHRLLNCAAIAQLRDFHGDMNYLQASAELSKALAKLKVIECAAHRYVRR